MQDILSGNQWLSLQSPKLLNEIENKIKQYELSAETVRDWFSNFSGEEEYQLALKVFSNIDYRTAKRTLDNIRTHLPQIQQKMSLLNKKHIVLVGSDEPMDSSNRFIYDLGKQWEVPESKTFKASELTGEIISNEDYFFIFFNDTHGTGNQFVRTFKSYIDEIGVENCGIVSLVMTNISLQKFKNVFGHKILIEPSFPSSKNIFTHQDNEVFNNSDITLLRDLGIKVYSKGALGYKDTALLVAYLHQCPNNTLPIIWANGSNNEVDGKTFPWKPLFPYIKIKEPDDELNTIGEISKITPSIVQNSFRVYIAPSKNPDFIGRENELEKIEENLSKDSLIYIVNGIGGVGKSELASEYFHKYESSYEHLIFIELTEDTSLEELFLVKFKDMFKVENFEGVMQRLQSLTGKNLLLIDNLERRDDFEKIKILNGNFDLLITTRLKDIDVNHQLELDTLSPPDAKKLFLSIYNEEDTIEDILEYLDNHPLFINLTAKSLKLGYITLDELRDDIENKLIKIDSSNAQSFKEHLHNRFERQFKQEKDDSLKLLLQHLTLFPSTEIKLEILEKSLAVERTTLQKLVNRGWLSHKKGYYKLHQIIKTFLLSEHPLPYIDVKDIFERIADYIDPDDSTLIASQLSDYIIVIESFLALYEKEQALEIARLLDSLTYLHYSIANYDASLLMQEKSTKLKELLIEDNSPLLAKSYHLKGVLYQAKGEYEKAEFLYHKSIKIREETLGEKHPDTAISYGGLASLYQVKGEYEKAKPFYHKSMKIQEEILGENHLGTATSYSSLASLYKAKGEYDKAEPLFNKDLKICEEILGEKHPYTATAYANIAQFYQVKEEYDKSEPLYLKAIKINEEILGENHPDTAASYSNIAQLYQAKGEYDKAEPLFNKDLKICEKILGEKHPSTATAYANIAQFYQVKEEYDKSEPLYLKAIKINEEILGENHPSTAITYNNLAKLYHTKGEYKKAELLHLKAMKIKEKILGKEHPSTVIAYHGLGLFYKDRKVCFKAKEYLIKCKDNAKKLDYSVLSLVQLGRDIRDIEKAIKREQKKKNKKICKDI